MSILSAVEQQTINTYGWTAKDFSGILSPFHFERRYLFTYILYLILFLNKRFFFFLGSFNLWRPLLIIIFYHQTKILISFWCRRGLNPISLIQPSETLPVELTGIHINLCKCYMALLCYFKKQQYHHKDTLL